MNPYSDKENIRIFSKDVDPSNLVWHSDKDTRKISILNGNGWSFQRDNELPMELSIGDTLIIPEGQIHRMYKGTSDLVIQIEKNG